MSESLAGSATGISDSGHEIEVVGSEMFCIDLKLCHCKELIAHLLHLCLSWLGQVSHISKQFSSSLSQQRLASLSSRLPRDPEVLCPIVLARQVLGLDGLVQVLPLRNSAAELQHSPLYRSPQLALKCP